MIGSMRAEWIKLSRRLATWLLTIVMLSIVVGLSYFFFYLILRFTPSAPTFPDATRNALKNLLYPRYFLNTVLSDFTGTGLGGAMILILGVLSVGSEYTWGTLKTMLTQRPGRIAAMSAKLLVLFGLLVGYTVLLLGVGAVSSTAAALLDGVKITWPAIVTIIKAFGVGVLLLSVWAAFGAALATLMRSNALPIGIGLVYVLIVEGILSALSGVDAVRTIMKALPGANATALVESFGTVRVPGNPVTKPLASPEEAVLVLLAYVVLFVGVTLVVIRQRDVT